MLSVLRLIPTPPGKITAGTADFHGQDLLTMEDDEIRHVRGAQISMIFQDPMTSLNPAYSIGNQLEESLLRHRKVSRREARDRAVYLLEKVGITAAESRLDQYPHQLSGGLRQRVMIAMGLMCDPLLLIADEPTTALDVTIQAQILAQLAAVQKEFDMGLILITHDLGVVARVADRVTVMYCGEVFETGTVTEVFEEPLHPYTQGLMACIPIPGQTRPGEHLGAIPGIVPTPIGNLHGCTFRNRCPYAFDACTQADVDIASVAPGRGYRCLLSREESRRRNQARTGS
jgi:peptide/nickel transport system ATP-binding protein